MIRAFKGTKYLSIPKDNFKIENIDDIEEVDDGTVQLEKNKKLKNVTISGVKFFEHYNACYACSGKVVPRSDVIGHCNKCGSMQRLERCIYRRRQPGWIFKPQS